MHQIEIILMQILDFFYGLTGSYGWAIILFTLVIKMVLYFPTQHQYKSMKDMQQIQPEIKRLQEKHKNEPQKLQQEQMELFKKHKVNPLGGCLPLILQMPILWAIWATIKGNEAKFLNATFLWIGSSLSYKFPQYLAVSLAKSDLFLLLLYGYSMYLSQKTVSVDPSMMKNQAVMNVVMPVIFTWMMFKWHLPCALVLYWLVFNLLTIMHQAVMLRQPSSIVIIPEKSPEKLPVKSKP
jgi:YidC/Oxa1 family membrane protein insertase